MAGNSQDTGSKVMGLQKSRNAGIEKPLEPEDRSTASSHSDAYHHGDLPQTLMNLALQHISASGTEKLSLRALARDAGVSPTAPYKHFASKRCLLAALATQGFQDLADRTHKIIVETPDLNDRVIAMSLGYIEFAKDNPTAYRLMFGSVLGDFSKYEMLHTAAVGAYDEVKRVLAEVALRNGYEGVNLEQFAGVVWALVHGLASLTIDPISIGGGNASPMQSIAQLKEDPEAAVRLLLDPVLEGSGTKADPAVP